mgnify:FL=1
MGLDMYLNSRVYHSGITYDENKKMRVRELETVEGFKKKATELEIAYWRKHPNLHGYIVNTFNKGEDDCRPIELTPKHLDQIADAIETNDLPYTEGCFFGSSEDHEEGKKENIKIFRDASAWLNKKVVEGSQHGDWFSIHYEASW